MTGSKVSIVIPVFNEERSVGQVVKSLVYKFPDAEIIIVNDGSTDTTAEKISELGGVTVLNHDHNRGYGASLKTGIRHAKYENILILDADGSYPLEHIPKLLKEAENYDMVIGARTGENVKIPLIRRPAKWVLNKLANHLTGFEIPDLNSGLRLMKKSIVIDFFRILPSQFSFTTTITLAMITNDYNIKFAPINYNKRIGKSKIRPIRDTLNFFSLVIRMVLYFNPLRFFGPISLFFVILSIIKVGYDLFFYPIFHFTASTVILLMTAFQMTILGLIADLIVSQKK